MNRREFLKISSLTTAVLFFKTNHIPYKALIHPALMVYQNMLFRGTSTGDILVSHDRGMNWQLHTRLGKDYTVTEFSKDASNHLHANIAFAGRDFDLILAQGNTYWLSV